MIVIIDNYDSFTYNLYQQAATFSHDVRVFRNDKITVEELKKMPIDGIILSPGPGRPEDAGICIRLIQQFSPTIPILGVCLGHQAIGIAFGARIKQANEIVHGKSSYIFHQRTPLFSNMSLPFKAGRYHSLIVEKETIPEDLNIEAENENGLVMAIKHRVYPCFGIQFHPESVLTPEGQILLTNFINITEQNHIKAVAC